MGWEPAGCPVPLLRDPEKWAVGSLLSGQTLAKIRYKDIVRVKSSEKRSS